MANITRFDPFSELSELDPFSADLFKPFAWPPALWRSRREPAIRLDVSESDAAYTVKAEIPGVKKDDINVSIDGNRVTISAEVRETREAKNGERTICSERYYGGTSRSFTLGQAVNESGAEAKYENGVLTLKLPKKPGTEAKHLKVS